jgi:urease accessory protein
MKTILRSLAAATLLWAPFAHAHHAMDNATPATLVQGLVSGLGHPVIGLDHLAFILAAGVLASTYARGWILPIVFVVASTLGAALHVHGFDLPAAEWWIGSTLLLMAAVIVRRGRSYGTATLVLFAVAGYAHGYALAESIVGAEPTPLAGYFTGLMIAEVGVATLAYAAGRWCARHRPALPVVGTAATAAALAGVTVIALALG